MASLVEFQDIQFNNRHHDLLQAITENCESYDLHTLDELMSEPLPTPPDSPDHTSCSSVTSPSSSQNSFEMEVLEFGEALLNDLLENEQLEFDQECVQGEGKGLYCDMEANFLISDCMWNSSSYEPRNGNGVYTPAPSPPPPPSQDKDDNAEEKAPNSLPVKKASNVQADCISPVDVFPSCHLFMTEDLSDDVKSSSKTKPKKPLDKKMVRENPQKTVTTRSMLVSSYKPRIQPQATSSESDEEIDVVTVSERTERPMTRMNTRKRLVSMSAPCSRHTSPTPSSPLKKRKYHTKRLQRLSSAGSNFEGTESDDEQRRASHNILERKRRNDLKYSFQVLREQIPELEDNQRAPKVTILRKAAEYIKVIREQEDKMEMEYEREKKRETKLRQRLAQLKSTPKMR